MEHIPLSRVLCVHAKKEIRSAFRGVLRQHGLEVVTACHGVDAYGLFEDHQGLFFAVVMEDEMPHMDGLELCACLRRTGFSGRVLVISDPLPGDVIRAYHDERVFEFLPVAFSMQTLAVFLSQNIIFS